MLDDQNWQDRKWVLERIFSIAVRQTQVKLEQFSFHAFILG